MSELKIILDSLQYAQRPLWESQRLNALFIAQKMVPKKLKLTDIYSLPWDHDNDGEVVDMELYMQEVHAMEKILNNNANETKV